MESARSSQLLIGYLDTLNNNAADQEAQANLQEWLLDCKKSWDTFGKQDSIWVIFNREGKLVARDPMKKKILNGNYSYRDYFHAYGADLDEGDAALHGRMLSDLRPHEFLLPKLEDHEKLLSAHFSDVYQSTATDHLQVTFTVPIWDRAAEAADKEAVGVFAISIELQNLLLPENAMIVQVRPNKLTGESGLVISHPQLRPHTDEDLPPKLPGLIEPAKQLMQFRLREKSLGIRSENLPVDPYLKEFSDPVLTGITGEKQQRLAAFEPVIISSRPNAIADTGWVVVVTEVEQSE